MFSDNPDIADPTILDRLRHAWKAILGVLVPIATAAVAQAATELQPIIVGLITSVLTGGAVYAKSNRTPPLRWK